MIDLWLSTWLRWWGGTPAFRIYGKAKRERAWRMLAVYATERRNTDSRWPLWRATCITWASDIIVVGWDFAEELLAEQIEWPCSRQHPVEVQSGRLTDAKRRIHAGASPTPSVSEILAHEIGHSWQVLRLGSVYLPLVGGVTWCREGPHSWNRFENEASEQGLFGGLVRGSLCPRLLAK